MGWQAVENVAVAFVRGRVPEFEPAFQEVLGDEGYWELSALQTFSELARWVLNDADADATARTFTAVEFVLVADSMREGNDEAVEFFETLAQELRRQPQLMERVRPAFGPPTREWLSRWAYDLPLEG